jgi:GTPase SAR1 family protein
MGIENIHAVDILALRKDGKGVELYIIASGHLDDSPETQTTLLDKIENYLSYINSYEFSNEFGKLNPENIRIILKCMEEPDPLIRELFKKIVPWVQENNASIELVVK